VSDQTNGKCILEMVGYSQILVHVNLTEFSYRRSVSGEVHLRAPGQEVRVSTPDLLRERTSGLHRLS
jgi:hypothetical protein